MCVLASVWHPSVFLGRSFFLMYRPFPSSVFDIYFCPYIPPPPLRLNRSESLSRSSILLGAAALEEREGEEEEEHFIKAESANFFKSFSFSSLCGFIVPLLFFLVFFSLYISFLSFPKSFHFFPPLLSSPPSLTLSLKYACNTDDHLFIRPCLIVSLFAAVSWSLHYERSERVVKKSLPLV